MSAGFYQSRLDIRFPDFLERHVFAGKLRMVILLGLWVFAIFYAPPLLAIHPSPMLLYSLLFVLTTISYLFIFRRIAASLFFIIELLADVAGVTLLVYLTGGPKGYFWLVYVLYTLAGGLFYGWKVSLLSGIVSLFFYGGLYLTLEGGWITPFPILPLPEIALLSHDETVRNVTLLFLSLAVAIYGVRLASHFSRLRENALEAKNLELTARNQVASLAKGTLSLEQILLRILKACREGLLFEAVLLVLGDDDGKFYHIQVEEDLNLLEIKEALGFDLQKIKISSENRESPIIQSIQNKKVVIRYELSSLSAGMVPAISRDAASAIQKNLGFGKFIVAPLVVEQKPVGALVGISQKDWVEEEVIRTFEGFADQAALVIENQRLIEELKKKNVELERANRAKSDFLAAMSHELRTPLNAILGFSDLLDEGEMGTLTSLQQEGLHKIRENANNLLRLINDLLDLAKIEAGKMELYLGPVSLNDLVTRIQGMIRSLVQKKGQNLEVHLLQPSSILYADEAKLQQILLNLLSNAIKFTPEKGRIVVDLKKWEDSYQVSISDNGIGIPHKDLEKVFDFFHQVKEPKVQKERGTGLGLALARQFAELHGGTIRVSSEEGKGSIFTVSLPDRTP
ncbi:MAG: GAF domain-containing protein [Deltaproteobacteria bacterium]|nr:GAF domain-containing protein [Deltaproteobacteria bacterium]